MRNWLEKNKVFFEVFSFVILGVASVFVSIIQYNVSKQELQLQEYQNNPLIRIEDKLIWNESAQYYEDEILRFFNDGGLARNFTSSVNVFYKIERSCSKHDRNEELYFHINDYFRGKTETHYSSGLLAECLGYKNNSKLSALGMSLSGNPISSTDLYMVNTIILAEVSYDNLQGQHFQKYFKTAAVSDGIEIKKNEFEQFFTSSDSVFHGETFVLDSLEVLKVVNTFNRLDER